MKKAFQELPGWSFVMDEVSAGVYEIQGRDLAGHCVAAKGIDLDVLIQECKNEASKITIEARNKGARIEELNSISVPPAPTFACSE